MSNRLTIGFIGNPNCGKTSLFNAYTGANLKVANWPGVTVEKIEGIMQYHNEVYKLVDLPGTYSLTSYTMEEIVSRKYILSDDVDVIVNVVDASSLERNLYLTLQLIELGKPVILALNMMDIVEKRGMEIDLHRLPEMLGIPVIPVSARKKKGLDILMHAAAHHKDPEDRTSILHHHGNATAHPHKHHSEYTMVYSDVLEDKIDVIIRMLKKRYPNLHNYRWHAIKLLEGDEEITQNFPIPRQIIDRSYETDIIGQKYAFISEVIGETMVNKAKREAATDEIDKVLTNRWLGMPIYLCVMGLIFFLTFTIGDWLKAYFEVAVALCSDLVGQRMGTLGAGKIMTALVVEGILTGVGQILTFLPNIFILFLALAFLEDSGYMSRVAYVMDGLMGKIGLSGRAFIPMLLGFGCSVPAIMASRALESKKDRYRVILVTPFMSCSARLPIYVLFAGIFFPQSSIQVAFFLYLLGLLVAVLTVLILHLFDKETSGNDLLIELPDYKTPCAHTIFIYVWGKIKDYLNKAGTIIFVASIGMWLLLNFGPAGLVEDMGNSFGSILGQYLVPILRPIGLGYWQIAVALIAGIAAKEVVVSSTAVLFGISNLAAGSEISTLGSSLQAIGFGPLNALSLMVFCLLYIPCAAAIATTKKESSWQWTGVAAVYQLLVAWAVSFAVFQIGTLI